MRWGLYWGYAVAALRVILGPHGGALGLFHGRRMGTTDGCAGVALGVMQTVQLHLGQFMTAAKA